MRSYQHKSTGSHQNSAVKRAWARVVLGWVTSWEVLVLHPSFLPCASNRTSPSILFFFCCSSSPTLCARAVTSGFPPQRCLRWGPPLVGAGPLRIIVEFQNLFSYNCRESKLLHAHMIVAGRREKVFFFFLKKLTFLPQRCKRAKCFSP